MAHLRNHSDHRNVDWPLWRNDNVNTFDASQVQLAVLLDIREELRAMHRLLACHNTIAIPRNLDRIARNTSRIPTKPRAKRWARKRALKP